VISGCSLRCVTDINSLHAPATVGTVPEILPFNTYLINSYKKKSSCYFSPLTLDLNILNFSTPFMYYAPRAIMHGKGKAIPLQALTGPEGSRRMRLPDFKTIGTWRWQGCQPLPPGTHFCQRLSRPQGHSATGRIMSMKSSNDTTGNRSRDLPVCNAVPQPTAPPRVPYDPSISFLSILSPEQYWLCSTDHSPHYEVFSTPLLTSLEV
jgi:hypothetical protein